MITEEQRAERKNYIGSSDAAAVLGLSRWKSPLAVWAEKTGQVKPEDLSDKLSVRLGSKMEHVIAEIFTEDTGIELELAPDTIYHKEHPFLAANIDRRVKGENALVEIKNVGQFSGGEWMSGTKQADYTDGKAPAEYIAQTMHQLMVTGWDYGWLVAAVGNSSLAIIKIVRDDAALHSIMNREINFWNDFVVTGEMPMVMSSTDKGVLESIFPNAVEGKTIQLTDAEAAIIESVQAMEADLKNLEKQIDTSKNQLRAALGDAESGYVGNHVVRWSNLTTTRLDVATIKETAPDVYKKFAKQTTTRRFLIQSKPITRRVQ